MPDTAPRTREPRVWLITGSTRGFGRELVTAALDQGDVVVATARDTAALAALTDQYGPERVLVVPLDVTSADAARDAVAATVERFGRLDVVANNAGYANSGAIEELPEADFRAQIETNLFGVVNVTRAALPVMRPRRSGLFLQFSSVGGRVGGTPGLAAYQAAKFGVEGFSAVLASEVRPLGLRVVIVEPGAFRTDWQGSSMTMYPVGPDYESTIGTVDRAAEWSGGIDVLVNNAASDFIGAIEEQEEADYRAQFEVDFFAAVELIRLVLPDMRARRSGTIINISSMDGIASLPGNAFYSAAKFALEGLTEALWQELEPTGVSAFLVEPGSFRTGIERRTHVSGARVADYDPTVGAFLDAVGTVRPEQFPGDPDRAAAAIAANVRAEHPRRWLILGSDAYRRIGAKLATLRAEFDDGLELAASTDFPGSGRAVL